jgi:hypothetical protein
MNYPRPRWSLESTRLSAHSAIEPAIPSIAKNRVNPRSCAIIARIHEQSGLYRALKLFPLALDDVLVHASTSLILGRVRRCRSKHSGVVIAAQITLRAAMGNFA